MADPRQTNPYVIDTTLDMSATTKALAFETRGYASMGIQLSDVTTGTIQVEETNVIPADSVNADWVIVTGKKALTDGSTVVHAVNLLLEYPINARYARIRPLTTEVATARIRVHLSDSVRSAGGGGGGGGPVTITDGSLTATIRDTGASDSLNVSIVDASGNQITSFGGSGLADLTIASTSVTSATTIFTQDCTGYSQIAVQVTSAGTTCTVTYEQSNNNVTFIACTGQDIVATTGVPVSATSTVGIRQFAITARYFRARVSTYTSGTVTALAYLRAQSVNPIGGIGVQAVIASGTVTTVSTLTSITNWGNIVDNTAFVDGTTRLSPNGYIYDEVAGTALTENDAAAARININRAQVQAIEDGVTRGRYATVTVENGLATATVASATGGYTPGKLISAATTNATSVKASAGTVGYITASNVNAAARYLKIYNKASAPTVGTDVPVHTFLIPGNTAGAGTNIPLPAQGTALSTGFAFAITTGVADADTGAVAANEIVINYGYK